MVASNFVLNSYIYSVLLKLILGISHTRLSEISTMLFSMISHKSQFDQNGFLWCFSRTLSISQVQLRIDLRATGAHCPLVPSMRQTIALDGK